MVNRRLNPPVILWVYACHSTDARRPRMYAKVLWNIGRQFRVDTGLQPGEDGAVLFWVLLNRLNTEGSERFTLLEAMR
jgi:hypothetical protein